MSFRFVAAILAALVVAAGAGWIAGASSRSLVERERARAEMQAMFADARANILDGRVNVYESSFGSAVESFQAARNRIAQIQTRLREIGQPEQAGRLQVATSHLSDAQHYAAAFDARAQDAADEAMKALLAASGGAPPNN
jgi:hypothetical protein